MEFQKHVEQLNVLNLPKNQYVVVGSAAMAVHGIREARDIDVLPSWDLWEKLKKKYKTVLHEENENIDLGDIQFLGNNSVFRNESVCTLEEMIRTAYVRDGVNYLNLELLKKYKRILGREKDLKDIKLIDEYLSKHGSVT